MTLQLSQRVRERAPAFDSHVHGTPYTSRRPRALRRRITRRTISSLRTPDGTLRCDADGRQNFLAAGISARSGRIKGVRHARGAHSAGSLRKAVRDLHCDAPERNPQKFSAPAAGCHSQHSQFGVSGVRLDRVASIVRVYIKTYGYGTARRHANTSQFLRSATANPNFSAPAASWELWKPSSHRRYNTEPQLGSVRIGGVLCAGDVRHRGVFSTKS